MNTVTLKVIHLVWNKIQLQHKIHHICFHFKTNYTATFWDTGGKHRARWPNPALHLVLSGQVSCFYPAAVLSSHLNVKGSYIYTVLKLHSALWRQPWGWCGPWWKWVWHPCLGGCFMKLIEWTSLIQLYKSKYFQGVLSWKLALHKFRWKIT